MAYINLNFYSESLRQETNVNVLIPDSKTEKFKTLWLLHGLSDNENSWMKYSAVARYAVELGIAVVMPCVDRSWYTDTAFGKKYFTFITEELPKKMEYYFKGYSNKREDNIIAGLSMGGYGAIKSALTYPEKYSFAAAFSGALDITRKNRPYDLEEWRAIFGFSIENADALENSKHDVFYLAKEKKDFPPIYMWCGTEDRLIEINNKFSEHLKELGVEHTYRYSEGDHSWKWWDMHLKNALDFWNENVR